MALTKKDLLLIKDLMSDQLVQERQYLHIALHQQAQDITRDIRDEMDARFTAASVHTDTKINALRSEILSVLSENILPAINAVHERVDRLEMRFDALEMRFDRLETRFDRLEMRFDGLETRIDTVEKNLIQKIDETKHELKYDISLIRQFVHMPSL